jgi:hypothetical protein
VCKFYGLPLENEEEFVDVKTKFITTPGLFESEALVTACIYQDSIPKGQAQQ